LDRRIATEAGADLILAGTRGRSPVAGLLLGSATERLLHLARQPVLVVPTRIERDSQRRSC
jgi:nucleotide-binding universal stress UspA family protein